MKIRQILSIIITILAMVSPIQAQDNDSLSELENYLLDVYHRTGVPAMNAIIMQDGQVIYERSFGNTSLQTPFHVGSLSKSFTATAILILVERGDINLDLPISDYLPELNFADPLAANQITVRHLLNQVSGFDETGYSDLKNGFFPDLEVAVANLNSAVQSNAPDSDFAYWNPNYTILGRLVEVASGQSFEAFISDQIFDPLELDSASFVPDESIASGYNLLFGFPIARENRVAYTNPTGGVIISSEDLARYTQFFLDNGEPLLTSESVAEILTPPHEDSFYAMGWGTTTYQNTTLIAHDGATSNFQAIMGIIPEYDYSIVLTFNMNHYYNSFYAYPQSFFGVIDILLDGSTPGAVMPTMYITMISGIVFLLWFITGILRLLYALKSVKRYRGKSLWFPVWMVTFYGITPILYLSLPYLATVFTGRHISFDLLAAFIPGVLLGFQIMCIMGILQILAGIFRWWNLRMT